MEINHTIRVPLTAVYAKTAKAHGFSKGIINLVLSNLKQKLPSYRKDKKAIINILEQETLKQILIMKQTNINQADFLLDVFERFGKDSQAAIDFVRNNMAELIENPVTDKTKDAVSDKPVAVDLGLPSGTLWCDRNVGAKSPSDCGAFFSWGNTEPHYPKINMDWGDDDDAFDFLFNWDNYEKSEGYKLEGNIDLAHDAARVNMGEPWQMPTSEQFQELYDNCTWERKTVDGVNGYLVTSKINGNSIFFACSGYGSGTAWLGRGAGGYYWSASFSSARTARYLDFSSGGVYPQDDYGRYYGFAVRPVQNIVSPK